MLWPQAPKVRLGDGAGRRNCVMLGCDPGIRSGPSKPYPSSGVRALHHPSGRKHRIKSDDGVVVVSARLSTAPVAQNGLKVERVHQTGTACARNRRRTAKTVLSRREKHGFAKLRMALPPKHYDSGKSTAPVRST
ncbi:hypothetical protein FHU14_001498 [Mesorhizobium sp. RMAD-H1]|nr:hypothetical protein [Mesorhizobium sp. RMAD-H1]